MSSEGETPTCVDESPVNGAVNEDTDDDHDASDDGDSSITNETYINDLEVAKFDNYFKLSYVILYNPDPEPWFHGPETIAQLKYDISNLTNDVEPEHQMELGEIRKLQNIPFVEDLSSDIFFINSAGLRRLICKSNKTNKMEILDWLQDKFLRSLYIEREHSTDDIDAMVFIKKKLDEKEIENQQYVQIIEDLRQEIEVIERRNTELTRRYVAEFQEPNNQKLNQFLIIFVKYPEQKIYDENRRLYYIPGNNNLTRDDMRFTTIRGQKRYCKQRIKELRQRGYELMIVNASPNPVTKLNQLSRELVIDDIPIENRRIETEDPEAELLVLKRGIDIDVNFDLFYTRRISNSIRRRNL